MLKRIFFGIVSALAGLGSLFAGYAVIYFHWDATNEHTVEELKTARWGYHIWTYLLVLCVLVFCAGLFSFIRSFREPRQREQGEFSGAPVDKTPPSPMT